MIRFMYILCLATLILSACTRSADSWPRIVESGVLRVGFDPTFPPFESADDNGAWGLDVDLANALAAELGLQVEYVYFGYDGLYDALATEQVDVLISALVVVPGRTGDFAYSEPYFNAGEILIVPAAENAIDEMEDLDGRLLAVELGALGHVEATAWAKQLSDLELQTFESADAALQAVQNGQADAALVDAVGGRAFMASASDQNEVLRRVPEPVTVEPFAVVVRKDDQRLLDNIDASLQTLKENGRLDQIIDQWLGP